MALNPNLRFHSLYSLSTLTSTVLRHPFFITKPNQIPHHQNFHAISNDSDLNFDNSKNRNQNTKPRRKSGRKSSSNPKTESDLLIPKKSRPGRSTDEQEVEDHIRDRLGKAFEAVRQQRSEAAGDMDKIITDKVEEDVMEEDEDEKNKMNGMVVEQEKKDWPVDAEVGWGTSASKVFEKYPIQNVVGDDGVEIDWEGESIDCLVKEINCLQWEEYAFHPSPLIVFVFERYNRASDNWKALMELEKAALVFWKSKDRLPPRTVKIDINIETDLANALRVRDCPQILFLRGNYILYREHQIRTSDELVQLIAHFYYKAKRPSWMKDVKLYS